MRRRSKKKERGGLPDNSIAGGDPYSDALSLSLSLSLCLVLLLASPLKKVFLAPDFVAREVFLFLQEILAHQIARSSSLSTHALRCTSSRFDLGSGGFFCLFGSVAALIGCLFAVLLLACL